MQNVNQTTHCCCWSPQITPVSPLCPYCGVSPPLLSPVSSEAECCSQETAAEVAEVQSLSIYNIVLVSSQPPEIPGYRIGEIQMIPGVDFTETEFWYLQTWNCGNIKWRLYIFGNMCNLCKHLNVSWMENQKFYCSYLNTYRTLWLDKIEIDTPWNVASWYF